MANTIIEILIDNSGSMGYMKGLEQEGKYLIDGNTRMTLVKKMLLDYIVPSIGYASKVIIRTFRSNSKKIGGKLVEEPYTPIVYQDIFHQQSISSILLAKLIDPPPGGTPISAAINAAISDLEIHENIDRKIILITDGEENGGGNFKMAAEKVRKLNGVPCKIFIIGIAQDEQAENQSREIASGGYYNIKSKDFAESEVQKALSALKKDVLSDSVQNIHSIEEALDIDSTTLTIDKEYSDEIRLKSESFLYEFLCKKYSPEKIRWLNENGESFQNHDFELLDEKGNVIQFIECKGTPKTKPTFYLTITEWEHFLTNSDKYQLYRVSNLETEKNVTCIDNLLASILSGKVVPYLLKPEILKDGRVFLTLK